MLATLALMSGKALEEGKMELQTLVLQLWMALLPRGA